MDITTPPPAPPLARPNPSSSSRLLGVAVVVGVIAVLIASYFIYHLLPHKSAILPAGYEVTVASNDLPLTAAYAFTSKSKQIMPLAVEGQGTAVVIDAAQDAHHGYYLIGQPNGSTNLFRQDRAHAAVGLEELTHSSTLKFDLSYDALSGVAAYAMVKGGERHVVVWSPVTKKETDIGAGIHPTLLPGGFFVVFERDGKLLSVRIETNTAYTVLTIPAKSVFAVDPAHMKVALYEPAIGAVQEFSIANSISASYLSSTVAPAKPNSLLYSNGAVATVNVDAAQGQLVLTEGGKDFKITLPSSLPEHYKLSVRHD